MFAYRVLAACLVMLCPAIATAAEGPPDGSTPEQKAAIAKDPLFRRQDLVLANLPRSRTKPRALFNGRDLAGWDSWLGYADPAQTYGQPTSPPIGLNHDTVGIFSVVDQDGAPAIFASGKLFGGLITREVHRNYHLHVEYKWGANTWTPMPRNNGVLYHSHGRYGAFFGTWMTAVEFEVVPHSVGMLLTVGDAKGTHSFSTVDWRVGATVEIGQDPTIIYPGRRYMKGGLSSRVEFPVYNVDAAIDAEKPLGQWNALDLYVFGDRSIHVVNGVVVMAASHLTTKDANGRVIPLTAGKIQLQSEGAETYFRAITIQPIDRLPTIVERKAG
ncbi:3-keto-disaccharide hydrolase [Novosphingobium aerophilum]|uniref:3-keto-disaccharide hydrolase n=1 Tax=Novosphingobium aerophilum TaxID=2839843 RepID=UPI001BE43F69|nr:DUF1080 domain-containing protein [Novosphingobium aerophilum]